MIDKFLFASILVIAVLFTLPASRADEITQPKGQDLDTENTVAVVFEGKLYCSLRRPVLMQYAGTLTETMVAPGDMVEKDDIIAQYEIDEFRALELGRQIFVEELAELRRRLESEKLKLFELERNERELKQLTEEKFSPLYMLQRLQKELVLTREYIEFLEERSSALKKFEKRKLEHIRNMTGDSTLMPGQIPDIAKVKAPVSGMVLSVHPQFRKDSLLPEGTHIVEIGKVDWLIIRSFVYERDVVHMRPGDPVRFYPDSLPEKSYSAKVSTINWVPVTPDPDIPSYYQVEITIENKSLELRAGFKGRVEYQTQN